LHICNSAGFYVFRLGIGERPDEIAEPAKVSTLKDLLSIHDKNLITAASQEDREIQFEREGKIIHRWASTILTQSVYHATEHRAQLIDTLEFKGYKPINLDDIDLWAFDEFEKTGN